jgi:hypothetical protein
MQHPATGAGHTLQHLTNLHPLHHLQGAYINQHSVTDAQLLYQAVQQCAAQLAGINFDHCPSCTCGPCSVHIDGNMKLLTFQRPAASGASTVQPSLYSALPGNMVMPDE